MILFQKTPIFLGDVAVTKDIITYLESLFHSGQVTGFVCSRIPETQLVTGWLIQGLMYQMIPGGVETTNSYDLFLIPGDRFVRLVREYCNSQFGYSLFLFGKPGIKQRRLVIYVGNNRPSEHASVIIFWTRDITPFEIVRALSRHILQQKKSAVTGEPCLDYLEQIRLDSKTGKVESAFSIQLSPKQNKIDFSITRMIESQPESEAFPLKIGHIDQLLPLAKVFSKWITQLEIFKKFRESLSTAIFSINNSIELVLWDVPRSYATFAKLANMPLDTLAWYYLTPFWSTSGDISPKITKTPKESRKQTEQIPVYDELTKKINELVQRFESINPDQLLKRIQNLEVRLEKLLNTQKTSFASDALPQSIDVLNKQFRVVVTNLEVLAERLIELEKQVRKTIQIKRE